MPPPRQVPSPCTNKCKTALPFCGAPLSRYLPPPARPLRPSSAARLPVQHQCSNVTRANAPPATPAHLKPPPLRSSSLDCPSASAVLTLSRLETKRARAVLLAAAPYHAPLALGTLPPAVPCLPCACARRRPAGLRGRRRAAAVCDEARQAGLEPGRVSGHGCAAGCWVRGLWLLCRLLL